MTLSTTATTQPSIADLTDGLPESNVTTTLLQALDYVVPGQWQNLRGFDNTIRAVSGAADPAQIAALRQRALAVYTDPGQNYRKVVQLYQLVDKADLALGAAALANKVGQRIPLLSFISRLTPKADTAQAIDLAVKLAAEGLAFSWLNGLKYENLGQFGQSLSAYAGASAMRLAALICVDGVIPLGPDFVGAVGGMLRRTRPADLAQNAVFNRVGEFIPGNTGGAQLSFLQGTLDATGSWIDKFVGQRGLTRQGLLNQIGRFLIISDEVLDYVGAFLDATTNYTEHTGIQTVSRALIERVR
jgi:hypothetical protein